MKSIRTIAIWGVLAPCFALALSGAAFAQSSTPTERAQTQTLNQNIIVANDTAAVQNDENNARFQAQLKQYRASQRNYEEKAARYEAEHDRYAAQRVRYHRGPWPTRYEHNIVVYTADLLGARVLTYNGNTIGRVDEIALVPNGHVDALRVTVDSGRGDVWIDSADLRYDADKKVVLTNLDRNDVYLMTRERY